MLRWYIGLLLVLVGCSAEPHRTVLRQAESLAAQGKSTDAIALIDAYLTEHPSDTSLEQPRFFLWLKADDRASARRLIEQQPDRSLWLARALRHRDPLVRVSAARLASETPRCIPWRFLARGSQDSSTDVRRYCVKALGHQQDRDVLKTLFRALHDPQWMVRAEAAAAMAELNDPRALELLIAAQKEGDGFVRYQIFAAIRSLANPAAHDRLTAALQRVNARQQFGVAVGLAKLGDAAAYEVLRLAVANPESETRQFAAIALGECGVAAAEIQLRVLAKDPERSVRQAAINALERMKKEIPTGDRPADDPDHG